MKKVSKLTDKVGQWTGEKLNAFNATKLDEEFVDLEKRTDATDDLLKNLTRVTEELLQPNPSVRSKLHSGKRYEQPEDAVSEVLLKGAAGLPESSLSEVLAMVGQAEKDIAEARMNFDSIVIGSVVKPMNDTRDREIKDVMSNRKKLESRRLDYDAKRRAWEKKTNDPRAEDDFRLAEAKFEEIKEQCYNGMVQVLENEPEHCRQLLALVQAQLEFHRLTAEILAPLVHEIECRANEAASHPQMERYQRAPSIIPDNRPAPGYSSRPQSMGRALGRSTSTGAGPAPVSTLARRESGGGRPMSSGQGEWVQVMYDFVAENPNELELRKGDQVELLSVIDDNWMQGRFRGRTGIFPSNFVQRM